jgi:hypothetical protein
MIVVVIKLIVSSSTDNTGNSDKFHTRPTGAQDSTTKMEANPLAILKISVTPTK